MMRKLRKLQKQQSKKVWLICRNIKSEKQSADGAVPPALCFLLFAIEEAGDFLDLAKRIFAIRFAACS